MKGQTNRHNGKQDGQRDMAKDRQIDIQGSFWRVWGWGFTKALYSAKLQMAGQYTF